MALGRVRATGAFSRHAKVAQRKVVLHRIVWVELPQRSGDLFGRCPARCAALGQSEIETDSMDVSIDGDHELGGRNRPEPEVDPVGGTNHPAGVENEALACASGAGITHQVAQAATGRVAPKRIGETGQGFSKISIALPMKVREGVAECLVLPKQSPRPPQDRREMLAPVDPMYEPAKAATELCVAGVRNRLRRLSAQPRQQAIDACQKALELDYQLSSIDYTAENFVHADMDAATFKKMKKDRK